MEALSRLVEHDTAGDPMSDRKWTRKTTAALADELSTQGFPVSADTVARLLRRLRYTLKANRKRLSEGSHPDRDRQFRYLRRVRDLFVRNGLPVISADTKKKELVGNFKERRAALAAPVQGRQGPRLPQQGARACHPLRDLRLEV